MDCSCNHDGTPTKNFPIELSTAGSLTFSTDTDSTSSTEIDSSYSKHSLSSESEDEICTPRNGNGIFRRLVHGDEDDQQIWLFKNEVEDFALPKQPGKSLFRSLRKRYYVLLGMGLLCALSAVRLSLATSKDLDTWTQFLQEDAARIVREIKMTPTPDSFTIVLKGSRLDMIQQSLDTHSRCPSVEDVVIDFDGMEHIPESLLSHRTGKPGHIESLSTQSLFLLEEGVMLSCDEIEKAFVEWKRDPRRTVGFFGYRGIGNAEYSNGSSGTLETELVPSGSGAYSLLSDRAMFIHPRYFEAPPTSSETSSCHLLLSMQVTAMSSKTPLVMRSRPRELLDAVSNPTPSSLRGGGDDRVDGCTKESVPRWLLPTETKPLRVEGKTILG